MKISGPSRPSVDVLNRLQEAAPAAGRAATGAASPPPSESRFETAGPAAKAAPGPYSHWTREQAEALMANGSVSYDDVTGWQQRVEMGTNDLEWVEISEENADLCYSIRFDQCRPEGTDRAGNWLPETAADLMDKGLVTWDLVDGWRTQPGSDKRFPSIVDCDTLDKLAGEKAAGSGLPVPGDRAALLARAKALIADGSVVYAPVTHQWLKRVPGEFEGDVEYQHMSRSQNAVFDLAEKDGGVAKTTIDG